MSGKQRVRIPTRRGVTIVETIVLMTVVAAILGLCVLLLQLLMKLDVESRARVEASSALGRLSSQFRQDLHSATRAEVIGRSGHRALRIQLTAGRTVEYLVPEKTQVLRVETEEGKPVRREQYEVPRSDPITVALDVEGDRQLARLTLQRRVTREPDERPKPFEIVASVGRNVDPKKGGGQP